MEQQPELFTRRVTWDANPELSQEVEEKFPRRNKLPFKMIYLVIVKRSTTWTTFMHVRARRIILKSELRTLASSFYQVPELNVTVI